MFFPHSFCRWEIILFLSLNYWFRLDCLKNVCMWGWKLMHGSVNIYSKSCFRLKKISMKERIWSAFKNTCNCIISHIILKLWYICLKVCGTTWFLLTKSTITTTIQYWCSTLLIWECFICFKNSSYLWIKLMLVKSNFLTANSILSLPNTKFFIHIHIKVSYYK